MNSIIKQISAVLLTSMSLSCYSQGLLSKWDINGNTGTSSNNFIGTLSPVQMNFKTNFILRMIMMDGGTGVNDGRIAIGNSLPSSFTPTARLHLHQAKGFNSMRFSTSNTGSTENDGFEMGMIPLPKNNAPLTKSIFSFPKYYSILAIL